MFAILRTGTLAAALAALMALPSTAQEDAQPGAQPGAQDAAAPADPISYFLGLAIAQDLRGQGFTAEDIKAQSLAQGIQDVLAGREPRLSEERLQAASDQLQQMMRARGEAHQREMQQAAAANKEKSELFLEQNAQKDGVETLQSGLQYRVLQRGNGANPTATDTVRVHYTGRLIDGTVFDSSVERGQPAEFPVNRVIPGWTQALQRMKVGDKWMLYIPPELAYGPGGSPPRIGPNEALVFEVELLDIVR